MSNEAFLNLYISVFQVNLPITVVVTKNSDVILLAQEHVFFFVSRSVNFGLDTKKGSIVSKRGFCYT